MNRWIGRWLIAVSALHTLFALVVFQSPLADIWKAGGFDAVGRDPARGAVVWFVLFGAAVLLFGLAVDVLEKAKIQLPVAIGLCLLLLAMIGVCLMPRSGFWLLFPPAMFALSRALARDGASW